MSTYLISPGTHPRQVPSWSGFHTNFVDIKRHNPHLLRRTAIAMLIWSGGIAAFQAAGRPVSPNLGSGSAQANSALAAAPTAPQNNSSSLATVVHASILPSGPSGQLLPPGTMAPDRTYTNSYARGQCTWYVASRRQIPPRWGNAASWYYRASSLGWSVGTVPAVGAIAWTSTGSFGHVALVEQVSSNGSQVLVSEMNYRGVGVKSTRWVFASQFKYIY